MSPKNQNRLAKQFEDASAKQLGEALAAARHVLKGADGAAKPEALLVVEYIESLERKDLEAPKTMKVKCVKFTTVDGVPFSPGQEAEITVKQYNALSRFFTKVAEKAALIALLLFLSSLSAMAQQYTITAINSLSGGTNNITTNGLLSGSIVTATKIRNFCVQANFKLNGAGTAGVLITEYHSGDGTNYETNGVTKTITGNGTSLVTGTIEKTNAMAGYYRYDLLNSNSVAVTNLQLLLINPGVKGN